MPLLMCSLLLVVLLLALLLLLLVDLLAGPCWSLGFRVFVVVVIGSPNFLRLILLDFLLYNVDISIL